MIQPNRLHSTLTTVFLLIAGVGVGLALNGTAYARDKQIPQVARNAARENVTSENAVLVLVDYTDGLIPLEKTQESSLVKNNAIALARVGKTMNLPIIVLGDEGGFRGKQLPELMEIVKGANFVPRHTPSAWREPKFVEAVKKTGRTKLIVAGITTDNCVSLLTLDALRANYDVHVVLDAGGSDNALAEAAAVNRLSHAGAVMTSWVQLASELMVDWEKPEGTAIGKIYAEHIGGPKTAPGAALQRPGAQ